MNHQQDILGVWPATDVEFNGIKIPFIEDPNGNYTTNFFTYVAAEITVLVNLATPVPVTQKNVAKISFSASVQDPLLVYGFARKLNRLQACKDLLDDDWGTYPFEKKKKKKKERRMKSGKRIRVQQKKKIQRQNKDTIPHKIIQTCSKQPTRGSI